MLRALVTSSSRFKLVVSMLLIVFLMGTLSLIIGINVIQNSVVREGTDSVRNALAATNELYQEEIARRAKVVEYLAKTAEIVRAVSDEDRAFLYEKLSQIKAEFEIYKQVVDKQKLKLD